MTKLTGVNWFQNTGYRRSKEKVGYRDASPFKIKHRPGFLETETHTMQFPSPSSPITAMQKILHCKIFFLLKNASSIPDSEI